MVQHCLEHCLAGEGQHGLLAKARLPVKYKLYETARLGLPQVGVLFQRQVITSIIVSRITSNRKLQEFQNHRLLQARLN